MPRLPEPASTTRGLTSRVFSALHARMAAYPGTLIPLHVGDTWLEPMPAARAEAQRSADYPGLHRYAPPHGAPVLLDAIAEKLERQGGAPVAREAIQVVSGATGGLSAVCQSLLEPGEEVLLPAPFWPLIRGMIQARGGVPVQVPFYDRLADPEFDAEGALDEAVTARTVAIYLNSPNNPTGACLGPEVARAVARVAERHDLWVITDEVYEDIFFGGEAPQPLWTRPELRERTIATHSVSKAYGLAGARVGYTHGPAEIIKVIRGVQTYQYYSAPTPMQVAAARALREGDAWLAGARAQYRDAAAVAAGALGLATPTAGTFLFFDASAWLPEAGPEADVLPFLERCVDAGVVLVPGGACGDAYTRWARLCFTSVPPDKLADAVGRLAGMGFRMP